MSERSRNQGLLIGYDESRQATNPAKTEWDDSKTKAAITVSLLGLSIMIFATDKTTIRSRLSKIAIFSFGLGLAVYAGLNYFLLDKQKNANANPVQNQPWREKLA